MPKRPKPAPPRRRLTAKAGSFDSAPVPVAGIGASAGGLEALELLLAALPPDTGMAFVVIQHLDPTRPSALAELLQRVTPLPVREVRPRTRVEADHVYVVPPGKSVYLVAGYLMLRQPHRARGQRLPIDDFFESLADALGVAATGVVLSGMGHDGTVGLRCIREVAGRTFAQLPSTAAFDEMPRSAIEAGVVDAAAAPAELPALLLREAGSIPDDEREAATLQAVLLRLHTAVGTDFSGYKTATVRRRIAVRMAHHKVTTLQAYLELLEREPAELTDLAKGLLIGVTAFFRDPAAWAQLERQALPALLAAQDPGTELRAWVPACSTGEEAYSLAIALLEALDRIDPKRRPKLRIFATDIDPTAIETARRGEFPQRITAELSAGRLRRFFTAEPTCYRVRKSVRDLIVFATHDIISDPPFTRVDLLSCRNLLIYLTPDLQQRLVRLFQYSLRPAGVLFLGTAETLGSKARGFKTIDAAGRIYRRGDLPLAGRVAEALQASRQAPEAIAARHARSRSGDRSATAEQALLRMLAPAGVVIDDDGMIMHWLGSTAKYLDAPVSASRQRLLSVLKPRLKRAVSALLTAPPGGWSGEIARQLPPARGSRVAIRITAKRLFAPASLRGLLLLSFDEILATPQTPGKEAGVKAMRNALTRAQAEVVALRRGVLRTRDQLGAANQELQSMNEELQSANEELMTSKEETQSMNEELQTVNAELQSKLASLSLVNDDLKNLLESTDIAIVFLDPRLIVRRFTRPVTAIARLIAADVGRPFGDIRNDLDYPDFDADIRSVLQNAVPIEKEVAATDGRWYRARIMPYQTIDSVMDGAVITFTDVSAAKQLEHELRTIRGEAHGAKPGQ
jgi:two-component system, chemotaxis family, CheB/CheR fusion protein